MMLSRAAALSPFRHGAAGDRMLDDAPRPMTLGYMRSLDVRGLFNERVG